MFKSLFFKPKSKSIDILPPPPPFPTMDFEEDANEDSQEQFSTLIKELDKGLSEKPAKNEKLNPKPQKERKPSKKELEKLKKVYIKQLKSEKGKKSKGKNTDASKKLVKFPNIDNSFGLKDIDLELKGAEKDMEFPDTLEELDKGDAKQKELIDAEEEIRNAIGKIKHQEKPNFLKRIFSKPESSYSSGVEEQGALVQMAEQSMPENGLIQEQMDDISIIQKMINDARNHLMNLNLEDAKRSYIEILKIYNRIKPQEQAKVYHDIREIYFERKSAEQLKS